MPLEADGQRNTVMIVDDAPVHSQLLVHALQQEYDVQVATTGGQALELARQQQPDLILLDIVMPEMDGYEVCRRLKAEDATRHIPVIFITAKAEADEEMRGLELGAVDYIVKPFKLPIVKARVRTHITLKKHKDLLERLAFIDPLTEIPNRRGFEETLSCEWGRARRLSNELSLLMMDIDYFKQFNDHYGHAAGDLCLKQVAQVLQRSVRRPVDRVVRYGGEEFVAVLPDTSHEGARQVAEMLRQAVEKLDIPHVASQVAPHVTLSIGVASVRPIAAEGQEGLVQTADEYLYMAKQQGRNRVVAERP